MLVFRKNIVSMSRNAITNCRCSYHIKISQHHKYNLAMSTTVKPLVSLFNNSYSPYYHHVVVDFLGLTAILSVIDGIHQVHGYIQLTINLIQWNDGIMSTQWIVRIQTNGKSPV